MAIFNIGCWRLNIHADLRNAYPQIAIPCAF